MSTHDTETGSMPEEDHDHVENGEGGAAPEGGADGDEGGGEDPDDESEHEHEAGDEGGAGE